MSDRCTRCGRAVPSYEGVFRSDGKGGSLGFVCGRCWAEVLSEAAGDDIGHLEIAPLVMVDASDRKHEFHFRYSPAPRGLEAFELVDGVPGGHHFQVLGDDNPSILAELLARIRRGLARQHLEPSEVTPGGLGIRDRTVRGRIEWDREQDGRVPSIVVDGKQLSWDQLGGMLMSFEGWQFRLEMVDPSEEL